MKIKNGKTYGNDNIAPEILKYMKKEGQGT